MICRTNLLDLLLKVFQSKLSSFELRPQDFNQLRVFMLIVLSRLRVPLCCRFQLLLDRQCFRFFLFQESAKLLNLILKFVLFDFCCFPALCQLVASLPQLLQLLLKRSPLLSNRFDFGIMLCRCCGQFVLLLLQPGLQQLNSLHVAFLLLVSRHDGLLSIADLLCRLEKFLTLLFHLLL